jgi:TRAP-type C4-dicarboxylate transport system permease small subunit
MKKYGITLILLLLVDAYCLYATAFFAWVTATPVSQEKFKRSQVLAQNWGIAFLLIALVIIIVIIRIIQVHRRANTSQNSINN